jgi:hypothetical protein
MDGNTPINVFEKQFSQSDAAEVTGVPNSRINNWIQRGQFKLDVTETEGGRSRRFFSVFDIATLFIIDRIATGLEASPAIATVAADALREYIEQFHVGLPKDSDGKPFQAWAWIWSSKLHPNEELSLFNQLVWYKPEKGFFKYHPLLIPGQAPVGAPHFVSISIPIMSIFNRIFMKCGDLLAQESGLKPGYFSQGMEDLT